MLLKKYLHEVRRVKAASLFLDVLFQSTHHTGCDTKGGTTMNYKLKFQSTHPLKNTVPRVYAYIKSSTLTPSSPSILPSI